MEKEVNIDKNLDIYNEYYKIKKPSLILLFFKRFFDIIVSLAVIIILSPFFIIFTIINAIVIKGNPFFIQKRPGKNGKTFSLIKYRTMTNRKDSKGNLLPDRERMTKFGTKIRDLSIDELPELFNILFGKMSFVGPRPQLIKDLWFMNDTIKQRHIVKPGLTGLAQIKGRNAITWEQKFIYDLMYIENMSLIEDIKIIFLTAMKVLKKEDITQEGEATADDYGISLIKSGRISESEWKEIIEKNSIKEA